MGIRVDGIHLRGSSGKIAYTRSVAVIMAGAGLTTDAKAGQVSRQLSIKPLPGHCT